MNPTAADTSTTGKHIPALDGLRGLAILLVMMVHLLWANADPVGSHVVKLLARAVYSGWMGVDLFFALSGFLITGILFDTLHGSHYFRNFYARRALRVFPLYYGFLALLVVASYVVGERWHSPLLLYLSYTNNIMDSHVALTSASWVEVTHFWSLAIEEQFYLCWPALVFLLKTKRRIVAVALTLALMSFGLRCYFQVSGMAAAQPYIGYAWTPARLDALLLGSSFAIAVRSQWRDRLLAASPFFAVVGVLLIATLAFLRGTLNPITDPWVQTIGILLVGVTACAAIGSVLRTGSVAAAAFNQPLLRFFGRYSYGLYVMHYTIKAVLDARLRAYIFALTQSKLLSVLIAAAIVLAASVLAAWLSFRFFEQPVLSLKRHFQDSSPRPKLHRALSQQAPF